jgi:uncharacterized RDD family membrane protein YckC
VVAQNTGARPGFGSASIRVVIEIVISIVNVLWIPWLLDHLWPIWDEDKQAWHDKAAGTVVVRV